MRKLRTSALVTVLLLPLLASQCQEQPTPECQGRSIQTIIDELKAKPKANPAAEVWAYTYQNQKVYRVTADCCDQYETLYDACLNVLCAPSGGFGGGGDGRCPQFYQDATDKQLVWRDPR